MRADADLSMRGIAALLGEFIATLGLEDVTLAMSDWGGPQLLIGGPPRRAHRTAARVRVRGL